MTRKKKLKGKCPCCKQKWKGILIREIIGGYIGGQDISEYKCGTCGYIIELITGKIKK